MAAALSFSAAASLGAVICAIFVALLWDVTSFNHSLSKNGTAGDSHTLPYASYTIKAPVASSWRLRFLARIVVSSPLGDWFSRKILDRNNLGELVELANILQNDVGTDSGRQWGLGEPLVRLSEEEYQWHVAAWAKEKEERANGSFTSDAHPSAGLSKYNSIRDYHTAFLAHSVTPTEVLDRLLRFVDRVDPRLRFVQELDRTVAALTAAQSTERFAKNLSVGIWDGVPIFVKSEIDVEGLRTTLGRQMRPDGIDVANKDDIIVSRLRDAGAIIVGTTVMHERGVQPTGYNSWYGGPRNPHDPARLSGGSSSGSAVAVAVGATPVAVGFDGGGSIRIPASWSGTVGLAVGYGRIPYDKSGTNVMQVAKAGVLAATVDDASEAFLLLGQPPVNRNHIYHTLYGGIGPPPPHTKSRWLDDKGVKARQVKIGVFWDWVEDRPSGSGSGTTARDDAVYKAFMKTVEGLIGNDQANPVFVLSNFTIPHMGHQALAHGTLITAIFSFMMSSELFRGSSSRESPQPFDDLEPATEIQVKLGSQITGLELLSCMRIRAWALSRWQEILSSNADVIITPTTPMTALRLPPGAQEVGFTDINLFIQMLRYVWPGNLIGLPGLAVPVGVDTDNMPVSIQVICAHWHEADCLAVGKEVERLHLQEKPQPLEDFFVDLLAQQPSRA